jgi:hypothetical protein
VTIRLRLIFKYLLFLVLLNILLAGTAFLFKSLISSNIPLRDVVALSSLFSLIALITLVIFFRGLAKEPDSQTLHTLVSVSLKFLLDLILALVWFFILKKIYAGAIISFFVIYLTFTLFTISVILKILKNRSL